MLSFFTAYPYLGGSLLMLLLACACMLYWRERWRMLAVAGLLCLPFACFSFEFIPQYWNPRLIAYFGFVSPEDMLFSFAGGALGLFVAAYPHRVRLQLKARPATVLRRYLLYSALGIGVGYLLKFTAPNPQVMPSTLAGVAVVGLLLWWRNPGLRPLARSGLLGFCLVYIAVMLVCAALWPHFIGQWTADSQLPLDFLGLPLFEALWAVAFGLVWPLYTGHILGASLLPAEAPRP